jgi:hypothetical protein
VSWDRINVHIVKIRVKKLGSIHLMRCSELRKVMALDLRLTAGTELWKILDEGRSRIIMEVQISHDRIPIQSLQDMIIPLNRIVCRGRFASSCRTWTATQVKNRSGFVAQVLIVGVNSDVSAVIVGVVARHWFWILRLVVAAAVLC